MGKCTSKSQKNPNSSLKPSNGSGLSPIQSVKKKDSVVFSPYKLVNEKFGEIGKEYRILKPPLGQGAFGEVRKAIHKASGITRAIKIMIKEGVSQENQHNLIQEVEILKSLDHPNIIKVYEFFQDENNFYIVTDLCTGGELFEKILNEKFFTEKKAAQTMKQILSAVFYCHQHKIVHRDLKPENLLFESSKDNSILKIIDFGTSKVFDPEKKLKQKFGTPYYIAPEVLRREYDERCDIWSCGVILFILLCGEPPFNGDNDKQILDKVKKGSYRMDSPEWKKVSAEAIDIVKKMLQFDYKKRIGASECLNHPWIQKYAYKNDVDLPQMSNALNNMRNFRADRKIQEASWIFLVQYLATKEEKNELLKTFQFLDENNDGELSKEELIKGYSKFMDKDEATEEVDRIFKIIDKNASGTIDYTEFVMATISKKNMLSKQRLDTAFKMFDKDGSGTITIDEIKEIFGNDSSISDEVWNEMLKEVDNNGDGQISAQEYSAMMMKLLEYDQKEALKLGVNQNLLK